MKLVDRSITEECILHPESHFIRAKWRVLFEEGDVDSKTLRRFRIVNIEQTKKLGGVWHCGDGTTYDAMTWFKGERTTTFTSETNDPQKKMVISMIENFLLDLTDNPMYKFKPNH